MPGIDLIDLSDPLLRERDDNALRLITHQEDELPDSVGFWYLWTAKEAVFKLKRELKNFNPKEIPITVFFDQEDNLKFSSGPIKGSYLVKNQTIVALAALADENCVLELIHTDNRNESSQIRKSILQYLKDHYNLETSIVADGDGLPIIQANGQPVSFTHHYHHMAFTFDRTVLKNYLNH